MAIDIGTSFNVQTNLALDERMVLTTEEMLNMNDNIMPDVYMATNKDDGKFYLYNKANDIDAAMGKFRLMKSEGGALVFTKAEWEALDPKPAEGTQVIISDDTAEGGYPTNENELGNWQQIQREDISQSAENPFVMPYDGYFNFATGSDGMTIYFSDDGVTWFPNAIIGTGTFSCCQNMYFKKGTKIYRSGGNTYSVFFVAYFEKRNYTNR